MKRENTATADGPVTDHPATSAHPVTQRRYPVGAELISPNRTHFRVWAPKAKHLDVVLCGSSDRAGAELSYPLEAEGNGYFSGAADCGKDTHYKFRLNGAKESYPDPASRYQPDGPHGFSSVVDPNNFRWTDRDWRGVKLAGQVLYEFHVGTFTTEG